GRRAVPRLAGEDPAGRGPRRRTGGPGAADEEPGRWGGAAACGALAGPGALLPPLPRRGGGHGRGGDVLSSGLLQIHDPLKPKGQAIGIDLGTTHSLVAAVIQGKPSC